MVLRMAGFLNKPVSLRARELPATWWLKAGGQTEAEPRALGIGGPLGAYGAAKDGNNVCDLMAVL